MSNEDAWRAARHLSEAADNARRAADRIDESVHTLRQLFEHGYGGSALRLIELLEQMDIEKLAAVIEAEGAKP